jgi:hypothetical protein
VVCIGAVALARRADRMYPISDIALIELSTMKAAHGHLVLGAYSRFQWRHPGPIAFYVLAPFYVASGERTAGLSAGAVVINLLALGTAVWLLARRGGAALAIASGALTSIYLSRVSGLLASSWNAHVAVLPTMAAVIAGAAVAAGGRALLPLFVLLASFAVQTHLAVLPAIAAAALAAACSALWTRGAEWSRPTKFALLVAAVVWCPPVVEQLSRPDGNLLRLARFFSSAHPSQPWGIAASAWADTMAGFLRPDFSTPIGVPLGPPAATWPRAIAVFELPVLAVVVWWAWRSNRVFHAVLAAVGAVASAAALWSATRIPEGILDHEVFWMSAVGLLSATTIAAAPLASLRGRRLALTAAALFLAAWTVVGFRELQVVVDRSRMTTGDDRTVRDGVSDIRAGLARAGAHKPLIRIDQYAWGDAAGMVLQLRKAGVPLGLEADWGWMFDESLVARGDEDAEVSISGGPVHDQNALRPGNVNLVLNDHIAIDLLKIAPSASSTR